MMRGNLTFSDYWEHNSAIRVSMNKCQHTHTYRTNTNNCYAATFVTVTSFRSRCQGGHLDTETHFQFNGLTLHSKRRRSHLTLCPSAPHFCNSQIIHDGRHVIEPHPLHTNFCVARWPGDHITRVKLWSRRTGPQHYQRHP